MDGLLSCSHLSPWPRMRNVAGNNLSIKDACDLSLTRKFHGIPSCGITGFQME